MKPCASDRFPQAALNAMIHESGAPRHDDGHTDCYYAGLLLAAMPHLVTDEMVNDVCAIIENRCGTVRGIGPAVREALAAVLGQEHEAIDG